MRGGAGGGVMKQAYFVFLLFDRRDAVNGSQPTKGVALEPIVPDDETRNVAARWAHLRMSYNSPNVHLEEVAVLHAGEGETESVYARAELIASAARLGALATLTAARQSELEKTDPTYGAGKEAA